MSIQNVVGLLQKNFSNENDTVLLWFMFVIVNFLDFISTAISVGVYGPGVEMNPIIRPLIEQWGSEAVLIWKVLWLGPVIAIGYRYLKYRAVLLLTILFLAIVYGNIFLH